MNYIKKILNGYPKITLSLLPTPIQKLDAISKICSANVYCKRDDLTGFAFGGNKTRKLDYLIADAKNKDADTIIAIGAIQSNFCRMVAGAAVSNKLEAHLVLGGKKPSEVTGNLLLDTLFDASIHYVDSNDVKEWYTVANKLKKDLIKKGKRIYLMPWGGSTFIGSLGYVEAFSEILDDSSNIDVAFDKIFLASSSGGTQSGLIVGKMISGWNGDIIGFGVAKNKKELYDDIFSLTSEIGEKLGVSIDPSSIKVDMDFMGKRYGYRTIECDRAIKSFSTTEGILLDTVYTGKAAAGLLDYGKKGRFKRDENILFIHTGGNIELFE